MNLSLEAITHYKENADWWYTYTKNIEEEELKLSPLQRLDYRDSLYLYPHFPSSYWGDVWMYWAQEEAKKQVELEKKQKKRRKK